MLEILRTNNGFVCPERWVDYALEHSFQSVQARKLEACPDCCARSSKILGQYIYYSTLICLRMCNTCRLVFSDTWIDRHLLGQHFERAYKEETYFYVHRRRVFEQLIRLVGSCTPHSGTVLDIGGGKGHFLAGLKQLRPDLHLTLNDISQHACHWAEYHFGLKTIWGDANELERINSQFNTVVMSDVMYYVPELGRLWSLLPNLLTDNGAVIIRVPNNLPLIRLSQLIMRWFTPRERKELQDRVPFFNPEHLFVFTPRYLSNRLKTLGFTPVLPMPSEVLVQNRKWLPYALYHYIARIILMLSYRKLIITPSFLILARKP